VESSSKQIAKWIGGRDDQLKFGELGNPGVPPSVTPKQDLPSCPLLASSSLSLPPTPMSRPNFFCFYVLLLGAYSHFLSEGSLSGGLLFRLCSFSLRLCLEG